MVWTCRAQHRLDCRSTQAECGCTEKIWRAKEIMGRSAWEWQKEARYGFCWPSKSFWVERMPSRKTCQKAQPSVEENRALKWIWWWWWWSGCRIMILSFQLACLCKQCRPRSVIRLLFSALLCGYTVPNCSNFRIINLLSIFFKSKKILVLYCKL